jgi:hypothetical protein
MDTFMDNIDVTVDEVLKKLSCLKTDKSAGSDSLHQKVLFDYCPDGKCFMILSLINDSQILQITDARLTGR